jgi:hypothetical protein
MKYFYYICYIPLAILSLLLTYVIAYPLAPLLPLFATEQMGPLDNGGSQGLGPRLPKWLNWFMTPDNSLYGDSTFISINDKSYWSQVKWLWRNPAYSFALQTITSPYKTSVIGDPAIGDNATARAGWCIAQVNDLFLFRLVVPIGFSRCIYCNFGWNIMAIVDPNVTVKPTAWQATFVFSPRISGFNK